MKSALSNKYKTFFNFFKKNKFKKTKMSSKIGPFLVFPLVKTPLSVYYKMLVIGTHLTVAKL